MLLWLWRACKCLLCSYYIKGNIRQDKGGDLMATKTQIEWCDYSINPVKGLCPTACPYCYARRFYKRFGWDPAVRFDWSVANDLGKMRLGSKVFWGSTIDLFGSWVELEWMRLIMEAVKRHTELTHIFLTKQPRNLAKWSPFPDNCWVGISATFPEQIRLAFKHLHHDVQAKVKFVSFEPMLGMILPFESKWFTASGVNWVIIGQQTPVKTSTMPRIEWVRDLVEAADRAGVPVFLKDNIMPLLKDCIGIHREVQLRKEFPFDARGNRESDNQRDYQDVR